MTRSKEVPTCFARGGEKHTRSEFNDAVMKRDGGNCVVPGCTKKADCVHHIMDRRIFLAGDTFPEGNTPENGACLCEVHHLHAEASHFPPQALRHWIDLPTVLPQLLDNGRLYDKWGNEIPSAPEEINIPRMPAFNFSPGRHFSLADTRDFTGKPLVLTVKMDGVGVMLTRHGYTTAEEICPEGHPALGRMQDNVPRNTVLFGEWCWSRRSIHYAGPLALPSPLLVWGVYDAIEELFFSWHEVMLFGKEHGYSCVPHVGLRTYDSEWQLVRDLWAVKEKVQAAGHAGVVVRNAYPFHYTQFKQNTAQIEATLLPPCRELVRNEVKN